MTDPVRFDELITFRCLTEDRAIVRQCSRARGMKPAEWVRQAVRTVGRLDGFDPENSDPSDALARS